MEGVVDWLGTERGSRVRHTLTTRGLVIWAISAITLRAPTIRFSFYRHKQQEQHANLQSKNTTSQHHSWPWSDSLSSSRLSLSTHFPSSLYLLSVSTRISFSNQDGPLPLLSEHYTPRQLCVFSRKPPVYDPRTPRHYASPEGARDQSPPGDERSLD